MSRLNVDSNSAKRLEELSVLLGEPIDIIIDSALDALVALRKSDSDSSENLTRQLEHSTASPIDISSNAFNKQDKENPENMNTATDSRKGTRVKGKKDFLKGKSGLKYAFGAFKKGDELPEYPGVFYITDNDSTPIYFERTENLKNRINELVKDQDGLDLTSYVHFHIRDGESFCKLMVEDLIEEWNPCCKEIDCLKQFISNM